MPKNLSSYVKRGKWQSNGRIYSVRKIIILTRKNTITAISTDHFDLTTRVWTSHSRAGREISVSPAQILRTLSPGEHYDRIMAADLSYPIIITWVDGKLRVVDGYHRLARAKLSGLGIVFCKIVTRRQLEKARI